MLKWLTYFFNPPPSPKPVDKTSLIGSKWIMKYSDPWSEGAITIIDEKDGWVRYQYPTRSIKWAMTLDTLDSLYKRID